VGDKGLINRDGNMPTDRNLTDLNMHSNNLKERLSILQKTDELTSRDRDNSSQVVKTARGESNHIITGPNSIAQAVDSKGNPIKQYVLVLDLDETLVHFKDSRYLKDEQKLRVRPGVDQFLQALSPYYKMIVFTAAQKLYA